MAKAKAETEVEVDRSDGGTVIQHGSNMTACLSCVNCAYRRMHAA